jgi:hypothetical protein
MTHHPYGPDELDLHDPELDQVAQALEEYATDRTGSAPAGLQSRILAAIDAEPDPEAGWWARLLAGPRTWHPLGQLGAAAAVIVIAAAGAFALAQVVDVLRPDVGATPPPSPILVPSESPTPSDSRSPSPSPSPTRSPSPSPTLAPTPPSTPVPVTPVPTASDDDDDDDETPEPSESDNSGPGGGGGGGDDDGG